MLCPSPRARPIGSPDEPPDYGINIGNPADTVVIDVASPEQAVAEIRQPFAVLKRNRRTVTRPACRTPPPRTEGDDECVFSE
jgi:hypothetical protein